MSNAPVQASPKGDLERGCPPAVAPHQHYWEGDVFGRADVGNDLRKDLHYFGVPGSLSSQPSKPPLLLAGVEGVDHNGSPFRWLARRHRKCVEQEHLCPSLPPVPISWFGWLDVQQHYRKIGWWVASFFTVGCVFFVISGVAALVRPVAQPEDPTPGLGSLTAALLGWQDVIGANLFFFPGGILQMWEATNMDLKSRRLAWEAGGRKGPRPGHHVLPYRADLRTVSWWAVAIQVCGMLGFNMATFAVMFTYVTELQPNVVDWCINFGFTFGGAAFTVSGVLFCWEATGSWWRGLLPTRLSDLRKISWHTAFWGFHGSVGFLIGGAANNATNFSWTQTQWIFGYGYLGGAVWFLFSSLAALLEQANPKHC